ncbi:MAG: SBBP repeat-containing protein [Nitrosomonadales bacterium]|nr:SBBP repeat-containing protein [Nitrosomonadales bacterium]
MMAVAILAGGCATNAEHGVFNYQIEPSLYVNRPMWPTPEDGEVPRYMYAGQLLGEENFRKPEEKREGLKAFLHWLGGLFDSEAVPVVLQRPQSGVVDSTGRFWVTDNSRQAVFVFDQEAGQLNLFEYADSATHFVAPTGIALGVADDIYVADSELGLVVRLNRKGESVGVIGKGELRRPVGLAFDMATRHLYVADTYAHDIKVFDADGRLLRTLGRRGVQPGEFNYPTFLAFANGELYVSDTMNARIQVLDAETGESKQVIGEMGMNMGNLVRPKGIAVDPEGNIYVVESYYDYLLVFNKHGEFLMPIGGTGQDVGKFYLPSGVWSDAMNRIFVADVFNGRIVLFQFLGGEG